MVSVIVPIYNVERYLRRCVDSLLAQTLTDIEIILVDDGSPDACGAIVDEYAAADFRVRVIHQPNSGVSAARNAGLNVARGEYIGFCDPDDFVAPEMYALMLEAIEKNDTDLVACGYEYYGEDYKRDDLRPYPIRPDELLTREDIYRMLADMPPTLRHGVVTKLFRKSLIGNRRFDTSLHSAEDADFFLGYLESVKSGAFIHKPLYCNLVRAGSATHGGLNPLRLADSFKVHDRMYRDTVRNFPTLRPSALAFLLDVCTLKYNESKSRADNEHSVLSEMRSYIRRKALSAIGCSAIPWKIRIYYLLFWIRK